MGAAPSRASSARAWAVLVASAAAAVGADSLVALGIAMVLLGAAWNVALISGSVLLTDGAGDAERIGREGRGRARAHRCCHRRPDPGRRAVPSTWDRMTPV
jgi:hypothetical protein